MLGVASGVVLGGWVLRLGGRVGCSVVGWLGIFKLFCFSFQVFFFSFLVSSVQKKVFSLKFSERSF